MKKDNTQSFAAAFQKFLKAERLDNTFKERQLIQSWEALMGKTIASRTGKLFVKNKILYIQLTSAPLKQEMLQSKQKVLDIISNEYGADLVTDIKFF